MAQSKRWCFTLNNPTQDERTAFAEIANGGDPIVYAVYGNEVAPTTGTPHLQGFVLFRTNQRLAGLRRRFGNRYHWIVARGSNEQASEYCKKEGDFVEFGELPPSQQGRRTDLERVIQWSDQFFETNGRPAESPDVAREQPAAYVSYPRFTRLTRHRAPPVALQFGELRDWQRELEQRLETEPDDRVILFVIDAEGNKGKSWFQRYMFTKAPDKVQLLGTGKRDDIAYSIQESKSIFLFNVPRGGMEFLQYTILEQLKDRCVYSPKYQSQTKLFRHKVHVVVFTNEEPDMEKMSADRYELIRLD